MTTSQIFQAYFQHQPIISTTSSQPGKVIAFSNDPEHMALDLITPENFCASARFLFLNGEIENHVNCTTGCQNLLSDTCNDDQIGYKELTCSKDSQTLLIAALRGDADATWKFISFEIEPYDGNILLGFVRNNPELLAYGNLTDSSWTKDNCINPLLMVDAFQALIEFGERRAYILDHLFIDESGAWAITLTEIVNGQKTHRYQITTDDNSWKITTYAPAE